MRTRTIGRGLLPMSRQIPIFPIADDDSAAVHLSLNREADFVRACTPTTKLFVIQHATNASRQSSCT